MTSRMIRSAVTVCVVILLAFAPALAEARAGSGGSMGSRGSRTYQFDGGRPIERSITPAPAPFQRQTQPAPVLSPAPSQMGNPFFGGLAGGFIGAGLFGLLSGHGFFGSGLGGSGLFGLLLQMLLIFFVVRFALRLFRGPSIAAAGPIGGGYPLADRQMSAGPALAPGFDASAQSPITITDADERSFTELLTEIQAAWSAEDIARLRDLTTPEMLSYFSELLTENASRGVQNKVVDVTLIQAGVVEAWSEFGRHFATARLRFSARDYLVRRGVQPDQIVDGDATRTIEVEEIWTFTRIPGGGIWLLSAIQQI